MARLPAVAINALTAVISICLTLLFLEFAVRVVVPQHHFNVLVRTGDRELGAKHVPLAKGVILGPEFKTEVAINSKGLRDMEYPYAKPPGTRRILCLGDSYTFGFGVEADETFAKVLERLLNAEDGESDHWEVINAGVVHTGTANHLAFFNVEGYRYEPDFVLLCICGGNDFSDNISCGLYSCENGRLVKHDARFSGEDRIRYVARRLPGYGFFSRRSHLMTFLKLRILGLATRYSQNRSVRQDPTAASNRAASELTEQLLLALRESCASRNATLVVTVVPQPLLGTRREMLADLVEFMRLQGLYYVNLFPRLGETFNAQASYQYPYYYPMDHHWTVRGHQLTAEVLCEFFAHSSVLSR
ncbi:MAG: GDSL-type esterase/lipase family protein [Candidatus Eisenbacteria bacterium]